MLERWQWDEVNVHAAIMLDWDDVQAVATRMVTDPAESGPLERRVEDLLHQYEENGATHLSLPELTLSRLLQTGELSLTQGPDADRVYLRAKDAAIANLVTTELQARLPLLQVRCSNAKNPLISFIGDLPSVAEVGLGFNPTYAELAQRVGLIPVARPIGYSWVQPAMIDRTLDQAAALGARLVAFQGNLIPGHEFKIQATVEAMRGNQLTYAYFRESRHQKGDWFLAKNLAADGLVILAHEFEPAELLVEDWHTISYRWANLAVEAGVRLCSVRFFRILHAADPLESLAYIRELSKALKKNDFMVDGHVGAVDLTAYHAERDARMLAFAGLSAVGAAGLATDLLPVPETLKLAGLGAATVALTGLPFVEGASPQSGHRHDHNDHHHHHPHDHEHHHDHHHHNHDRTNVTAYAPKGLSLAAAVTFPAAAVAIAGATPATALLHNLAVTAAGAAALTATTHEADYLLGIEEYRGYNLDWIVPLILSAIANLVSVKNSRSTLHDSPLNFWRWLPLAGLGLIAVKSLTGSLAQDWPASLDREHRHAHTHHLSAFQRNLGDLKMALSPRPLRKWSLFAPLGAVAATLFQQNRQEELAAAAMTAAVVGQVSTLTGFRNGQRPILKTAAGRAKGWGIGLLLAGLIWLMVWLLGKRK
jgi:hypothetical protein